MYAWSLTLEAPMRLLAPFQPSLQPAPNFCRPDRRANQLSRQSMKNSTDEMASSASAPSAAQLGSHRPFTRYPLTACEQTNSILEKKKATCDESCQRVAGDKFAGTSCETDAKEAAAKAEEAEMAVCEQAGGPCILASQEVLDASGEAPQCFVCFEDLEGQPARRSACACVDRHIHDTCLLEMISRSKAADKALCTVCLQPYENVKVRQALSLIPSLLHSPSLIFSLACR